ncbi:unnamed protein product [Caenorhabditis angaria]|uniref:BTB domain-containing protein n=1 Tax=Caenorhabditis angaria TaxID=860376 RepID=A0A9P1IU94_9PELO|nr:unnamed protein product [Caenorhabditis angaria]
MSDDSPIKIINLNVGGQRFATSSATLSWIPDTFFTSLISGRMHSVRDETDAIFIDRDPEIFRVVLNYLRTKEVDLRNVSISSPKTRSPILRPVPFERPEIPVEFESAVKPTVWDKGKVAKKSFLGENLKSLKSELAKIDSITEPMKVRMIRSHNYSLVVAYANFVSVYRDYNGWSLIWTSPKLKSSIKHISINSKGAQSSPERLLAISTFDEVITLWNIDENGTSYRKGCFTMGVQVDNLFFVGTQMVALSRMGKCGIWHSATQNWQAQDMSPISCYDTAGSSLLLGCTDGALCYIDMQKFPLRMKDNDLLVTELYRDPDGDCITAISVFLTPKTSVCGNWIEIAYGTSSGTVRVIVQHPETVGHGPQLFQTYKVHNSAVTRISLTTAHLISVCAEYNHVRSWLVTRFRGMISTQPGTMNLASFKVLTLDSTDETVDRQYNEPGPYGDQDSEQVFIQRVIPNATRIYVRLASTGERICVIDSVDFSPFTSFFVHECDGASRIGNRPRRYLFCGTVNGSVQMWDLTTALDQFHSNKQALQPGGQPNSASGSDVMKPALQPANRFLQTGLQTLSGPTPQEFLDQIKDCDICCLSSSVLPTPCSTPHLSATNLNK